MLRGLRTTGRFMTTTAPRLDGARLHITIYYRGPPTVNRPSLKARLKVNGMLQLTLPKKQHTWKIYFMSWVLIVLVQFHWNVTINQRLNSLSTKWISAVAVTWECVRITCGNNVMLDCYNWNMYLVHSNVVTYSRNVCINLSMKFCALPLRWCALMISVLIILLANFMPLPKPGLRVSRLTWLKIHADRLRLYVFIRLGSVYLFVGGCWYGFIP